MHNPSSQFGNDEFDAIVRRARLERSAAIGAAIANLIIATMSGLACAGRAIRAGITGPASATLSGPGSGPDAAHDTPARR